MVLILLFSQTFIIPDLEIYASYFYIFSMDKFNSTAVNHLLSFDKAEQISKMSKQQRQAFNNQIKKQAAYFMLSVSRAVQNKDYKTAKDILIYIADSCSCIEDPDFEVRYLIEVCCQHLAFIRETEGVMKDKIAQTRSIEIKSQVSHNPMYYFKYNKFKGEFQCDDKDKLSMNQSVLFYMSKLNAILFNEQNTQNLHSLFAMLKYYYPYFIAVFIQIFVLIVVTFSDFFQYVVGDTNIFILAQLPQVTICLLFFIPLVKIYLKEPVKKNSTFFEKKLENQIKKINQECYQNNENIKFLMPQGIQINVQIGSDDSAKPLDRCS